MTSTAREAIATHRAAVVDALRALGVAVAWEIRPAWVNRPDADTVPLEIAVKFRKRPVGSFAYYSRLMDLEREISDITGLPTDVHDVELAGARWLLEGATQIYSD